MKRHSFFFFFFFLNLFFIFFYFIFPYGIKINSALCTVALLEVRDPSHLNVGQNKLLTAGRGTEQNFLLRIDLVVDFIVMEVNMDPLDVYAVPPAVRMEMLRLPLGDTLCPHEIPADYPVMLCHWQ